MPAMTVLPKFEMCKCGHNVMLHFLRGNSAKPAECICRTECACEQYEPREPSGQTEGCPK